MTRRVEYVDTQDGIALFVTPSWTGRDETYEITVEVGSWMVRCNCFGANRWHLYADLLNPEKSKPCKHAKIVSELIRRHLDGR